MSLRAAAAGYLLVLVGCASSSRLEPFVEALPVSLGSTGMQEPAHDQPEPEAAGPQGSLTEQQKRQLQVFAATLLSPSPELDAETRRSAAQELLAMNLDESFSVIDQALRTRTPAIMLAAINAMQATKPVPGLLASAVASLPGAPPSVLEPLSWTLARYGDAGVRLISPLALDQTAPVESRLNPIRALGAFDSQAAAAALMVILHREDESAELIATACESMQRLTGLSYNSDVRQWKLWWTQARDQSPEEWSAFVNQSLSKRATQLQQDLQRQREASERIARELFNAYRDLYPTLPVDEQLRRLAMLLQDSLPPLREFAITRIALLLRDSVRIPMELQQKLAERLGDEVPALRIEAAKLLDEMNYEPVGLLLAERLHAEQAPTVVAAYLDVLSRRPTGASIEPARRWLGDASFGPRAANAIWRALQTETLAPAQAATLALDVRAVIDAKPTPAAVRVLALIGNEDDITKLTRLLDGDDPAMCAAVAEGFCQRGLREPLIQRASIEAVYPFALRAIVQGSLDVATLRRLVAIPASAANRPSWIDACMKVCAGLDPNDVLAADDLLVASPAVDASVRLALLERGCALPRGQMPNEHRIQLVARYAPILTERGDAAKAHALLESIGCSEPQLGELCFAAAALSGNYEKASQLHETAAAWVGLLIDVANRDLVQAAPLLSEIMRRFQGRLQDQEQKQVDRIARLIRDSASASASPWGSAIPQ